jgi:hypothetical protein
MDRKNNDGIVSCVGPKEAMPAKAPRNNCEIASGRAGKWRRSGGTPLHRRRVSLRWRQVFSGDERSLRDLRHWLASLLPACPACDDVISVANELASNAIRHTANAGVIGGQQGRVVWAEITWDSPDAPVAVPYPHPGPARGRAWRAPGFHQIRRLTDALARFGPTTHALALKCTPSRTEGAGMSPQWRLDGRCRGPPRSGSHASDHVYPEDSHGYCGS